MVIAHNDKFWKALVAALDCPELLHDERLATTAGRAEHRDVVEALFAKRFLSEDLSTWVDRLTRADAIFAPVRSLPEVLADERVQRDMLAHVEHPTAGALSLLANPVRFSGTPASIRQAPPTLGQHSEEVLTRLEGDGPWLSSAASMHPVAGAAGDD